MRCVHVQECRVVRYMRFLMSRCKIHVHVQMSGVCSCCVVRCAHVQMSM